MTTEDLTILSMQFDEKSSEDDEESSDDDDDEESSDDDEESYDEDDDDEMSIDEGRDGMISDLSYKYEVTRYGDLASLSTAVNVIDQLTRNLVVNSDLSSKILSSMRSEDDHISLLLRDHFWIPLDLSADVLEFVFAAVRNPGDDDAILAASLRIYDQKRTERMEQKRRAAQDMLRRALLFCVTNDLDLYDVTNDREVGELRVRNRV